MSRVGFSVAAPEDLPHWRLADMDTPTFPPLANLNLRTQVQLAEHSYEHAVLRSMLASAQATGGSTFRVFRLGQMTSRMDPTLLIDRLALRQDWVGLRSDARTLIVRATNLFGIIEASGSREKCSLVVQLWTDTPERGDAATESILIDFPSVRIPGHRFLAQLAFFGR
jgi:hypothetical protein